MTGTRRFVKVFLASPGDLAEERKAAKVIVDEFNSQLAEPFGCQVELVGWEDTLPGVGRPQAIINRDLDGCDLFVGMLWKRWGTPPGTEPYTSGFEEEFKRSLARNESEGRPEINLLLKDVDAATLADPGDHLKRVLAFKEQVFTEKKLLAGAFSDVRDFEGKFRRCIQGYIIGLTNKNQATASEKDQGPLVEPPPTQTTDPGPTTPLSIEGARFLREFIKTAETATDEKPLAADEVARLRLLSIIAAVHGNDEQTLGSHDANLLFKARTKFSFGKRELIGLLNVGLDHFELENSPLWYWLGAASGFANSTLPLTSIVGPTARRIGALKAMRLISLQLVEEKYFGRKEVISAWLSKGIESAAKVAALEYLSECGQHSDLVYIYQELAKNETQTSSAAAEAVIRITLRDDRRAALEALYALQPSTVTRELIADLFSQHAEFSNEILLRGISHRSASVRSTVAKLLRGRHALAVSVAEQLLNDGDAEVRYEAMQTLIASGRSYSIEQAKAALIRKSPKSTGLGLLSTSQSDTSGESLLELYEPQYFDTLSDAQLEEESLSAIFDQNAYFALVRRDFKSRGDDLRKSLANRFVVRFDAAFNRAERFLVQTETLETTKSLGPYLRQKFMREGLNIICKNLDPTDLQLVRSMLAAGDLEYSVADLLYLTKFGQWCDIPLVIASIERPQYGRKHASLLSVRNNTKHDDVARALYALGRHRLEDLLTKQMSGHLLARLIRIIPDKAFQRLSNDALARLMRLETEEVRKMTSLKYLRAFPRRRVKQFLEAYMDSNQFYYNVIHWLDFGVSVPRERMLHTIRKLLAD